MCVLLAKIATLHLRDNLGVVYPGYQGDLEMGGIFLGSVGDVSTVGKIVQGVGQASQLLYKTDFCVILAKITM